MARNKIVILCILALAWVGGKAFAESGKWVKLNGPEGCNIADVAVDPSDSSIVYLALDARGFFKSTDGGETWALMPISTSTGEVREGWRISVDPENPQVLYAGTWTHGIFKSMDAGDTWEDITGDMPIHTGWDIVIHPLNSQIIYLATEQKVFCSYDAGASWEEKSVGITHRFIRCIAIDPVDTRLLYAGTVWGDPNYIYKSTDRGENWSVSGTFDKTTNIYALEVDEGNHSTVYAATESGVFKSTDMGQTWLAKSTGIANLHVRDVASEPSISTVSDELYCATWGGLYKSYTDASSWADASISSSAPFFGAVTFDPSNSDKIYAGGWDGVYKSTNDGDSWSLYNEGLDMNVSISNNSLALDPNDSRIIYASTYGGGVHKSIDAGVTWIPINVGMENCCGNGGVACASSNVIYAGTDGGGIYKSTDAGASWLPINEGLPVLEIINFKMDPYKHNVLYLATGKGASKTTDGGETWFPINNGLSSLNIKDFAIVPSLLSDTTDPVSDTQVVYMATDGDGVYKSTDGGANWFSVNNGLTTSRTFRLALDPTNYQTLYVGTITDGIFKTTDAGLSWFPINTGLDLTHTGSWANAIAGIVVDPADPDLLYAGMREGGVYRSIDGGTTWIEWNDGLDNKVVNALIVDSEDSSLVYVGTGGGIYRRLALFGGTQESPAPDFELAGNFPNPFVDATTISYTAPGTREMNVSVFDVSGKKIRNIFHGRPQAGRGTLTWDGTDEAGNKVPAGVYFCTFQAGPRREMIKLLLVK